MTKTAIVGRALATLLVVALVLTVSYRWDGRDLDSAEAPSWRAATTSAVAVHEGHLYGRVTMDDGTVFEGRLRFGGDEEALWSHFFNGRRRGNPWVDQVPAESLPQERVLWRSRPADIERPFMARMGEIARIDARGRDYRVTLKSGAVVELARFEADDLADGLRVWDAARGVADLGEWGIRSIEFMPAPTAASEATPTALYGTVHTREGAFTGLIQWDREQALASDELVGEGPDGAVRLRFDAVRSITRREGGGSVVVLGNGRDVVLTGSRDVDEGNAGVYVDDARYGRVLVPWAAFRRLELGEPRVGPAYDDFAAGRPLAGTVVTRSGDRITGRLVFDLDESETTETLDAPWRGVDYMLPFGRVTTIDVAVDSDSPVRVALRSGEVLELERSGDLGDGNAGLLVFGDGGHPPRYVPWAEVERVEFEG